MVTVAQTALKRSQGRLTTRGFSVLDLGGFVFRVLHFGPFRELKGCLVLLRGFQGLGFNYLGLAECRGSFK